MQTERKLEQLMDTSGKIIWSREARGRLTRLKYDDRALLIQLISDVDVVRISDEPKVPAGWQTATGAGQHIVTDYTYDEFGRLTRQVTNAPALPGWFQLPTD